MKTLSVVFRPKESKWYIIAGLLFCFLNAYPQQSPLIKPTDKVYIEKLNTNYRYRNEQFIDALKEIAPDRKLRKHYEETYEGIFEMLLKTINEGYVADVPVITDKVDYILKEIKEKNPNVPANVQVLIMRDNQPNAHTVGDNVLFVDMGLFYYMQSDDQVACVLAHEIGHGLLNHSIQAITYNYERDKESVADVRAVREREVKKADYAFKLLKESLYNEQGIRRRHEMEADSVAYMLIKNTRYNKHALPQVLNVMAKYDSVVRDDLRLSAYHDFFDLPDQKFDSSWLEMEDFSSYNYESYTPDFDEDSLSSHPEVAERIEYLGRIFPELKNAKNKTANKSAGAFKEIQQAAEKERIPNLYHDERYGEAVYMALLYLQDNPEDQFYKEWLGINLEKLYAARKDYQLNKYLDRVDPKDQRKSYVRYLNFMWNLSLEELKQIADYYAVQG